jgi:16S rRNA (cytosine1402-N4)-methyltransferase
MFHKSVLLKESIDALAIRQAGIYVDATFGGGGHSKEILKYLGEGKLFGFDQDEDAVKNALNDPRFTMINSNFRYIKNFLKLYRSVPVDGILADLGISSHQIDVPERGFSTRYEAELDMRMDQRSKLMAKDVVNNYSEEELVLVFHEYGEIRNAMKVARAIAGKRREKAIVTTKELMDLLMAFAVRGRENKYFAQVFQALRIEVNKEMDALKEFLVQSTEILKPGGRLVVISYHSLEDKLVKNYFRAGKFTGEPEKDFYGNLLTPLRVINRKPIVPGEKEVAENPRGRSARLRIAEKI